MDEQYQNLDPSARLRDLEERFRLVKERVNLLSKTIVEEREKTTTDIQELKKNMTKIQEDNRRIKELLERITEQLNDSPRREELMILQRQFDMFRKA